MSRSSRCRARSGNRDFSTKPLAVSRNHRCSSAKCVRRNVPPVIVAMNVVNHKLTEWVMTGLEGKVALISGAAQGIGQGCAERMAKEGAKVVAFDIKDDTTT